MVDPGEFRRVMGRYATGVTVVTTRHEGVDHALTANSFTSVSLEPLLTLICVERTTRFHEPVLASGRWAVSVLPADLVDASKWFADSGRPEEGQFDAFATSYGEASGAVVFDDALAVVECRTWATYDGGDHTIVVGEVLSLSAGDGVPLVYYSGRYLAVSDG